MISKRSCQEKDREALPVTTRMRTPLNSGKDMRFELRREPRMKCHCLSPFAVECLKEVETSFASELALEDLHAVEGHASRV